MKLKRRNLTTETTMPPYVIYHENANTHREMYVTVLASGRATYTYELREAARFKSARAAYQFADLAGLDWWRVGTR